MLSSPRSLGFVLAVILGAMLVPGCRPPRSERSQSGFSEACAGGDRGQAREPTCRTLLR